MPGPDQPADEGRGDDLVLDIQNVDKTFRAGRRRIHALRDVSLRVRCGRVMGLIGPDGAGKTTLMRLVAGLLLPDAGRVTVLGWDTRSHSLAIQGALGYMPQQFGLYEDLTVQENLDLYADLQGEPKTSRPERYRALLSMTGLGPFGDRLAGRLSGGMKQKLGLACALVRPSPLLLLDEPTAGVDPLSRRELWAIVDQSVRNAGMSVLLSTAYLDEADRCDEVTLLHEGRLLGVGTPASFRDAMRGRTFAVSVPAMAPRMLQARLTDADGVTDATVQGAAVRLTMGEGVSPRAAALLPGLDDIAIRPVEPRFEDGVVAMLRSYDATPSRQASASTNTPQPATSEPPDEPVIRVEEVRRRFGDFYAVKGVTFAVRRGEIFGLLGANGAGKSTTFRMLCGLLPPSAGRLRVAGVDVRHAAAAARARIGYMSQKFSLYGTLSVEQNLRFFSSAYGLHGRRRASRMQWAIEQFGLDDWLDTAGETLPLGYQKRLSMACALMHEPDVLFLDEPTSGVDPLARREFWQEINALAMRRVTVLVTTHFMEEAEYCDRLAIMAAGQILNQGTPEDIRRAAPGRDGRDPTIEDAFIHLIEARQPAREAS